jgi:hypothetical protein
MQQLLAVNINENEYKDTVRNKGKYSYELLTKEESCHRLPVANSKQLLILVHDNIV